MLSVVKLSASLHHLYILNKKPRRGAPPYEGRFELELSAISISQSQLPD